jgi:isoquinoline 1-oxidoreductase
MRRRHGASDPELSQHEIDGRLHWFDVDRRRFLRILGGGVLVCAAAPIPGQESRGRGRDGPELPREISSWIHIAADGRITVFTGKIEMGQNIRTSLAQQVAEELRVGVDRIELVMGDTDRTPFDMGTFGSRTTPTMGPQLRKMATAARRTLIEMAARSWGTSPDALSTDAGRVVDAPNGRTASYGELTRGQNLVKVVSAEADLTPAAQWTVSGTPVPKVAGRDFVTGRHVYASDLVRPGMLHGKVLRPEGFHGELVSLDAEPTKAIAGVRVVRDGDFVGVVAPDLWTAERGLSALKARWKVPEQPSDQEIFGYLKKNPEPETGGAPQTKGSVAQALSSAEIRLEKTYTVAYIAHNPSLLSSGVPTLPPGVAAT